MSYLDLSHLRKITLEQSQNLKNISRRVVDRVLMNKLNIAFVIKIASINQTYLWLLQACMGQRPCNT